MIVTLRRVQPGSLIILYRTRAKCAISMRRFIILLRKCAVACELRNIATETQQIAFYFEEGVDKRAEA